VKKKDKRAWYKRLKRTVQLKERIEQIISEWPTDGSCPTDQEMDVSDACEAWERDMNELPEQETS
jgi:hypothetical protein